MKNTTAERNRELMTTAEYLHYRRGARGLFRAHNRAVHGRSLLAHFFGLG